MPQYRHFARHAPQPTHDDAGSPRCTGGKRIDLATMYTIHAEAAETLSLWQCLTDEVGTVVAAEVIRFEHHGTIAGRHGLFGKSVFIHRPFA